MILKREAWFPSPIFTCLLKVSSRLGSRNIAPFRATTEEGGDVPELRSFVNEHLDCAAI
jgi:hypothetical protein